MSDQHIQLKREFYKTKNFKTELKIITEIIPKSRNESNMHN